MNNQQTTCAQRAQAIKAALVVILGYGCFQSVSSVSYLSAMGSAAGSMGFVTQLPFMLSGCIFGALAAVGVILAVHFGHLRTHHLSLWMTYGILMLGILAGNLLAFLGMPDTPAGIVLGALRGLSSTLLTLVWTEILTRFNSNRLALVFISGYALKSLMAAGLVAFHDASVIQALMIGVLVVSYICAWWSRKNLALPEPATGVLSPRTSEGRVFISVWLCLLVSECIVGIANTAVFNSSFSSMLASINMHLCSLIAVCIVALIALFARKVPDPRLVFKSCMPVMLLVFSTMPFLTEIAGTFAGYTMIASYEAINIVFSIYLVGLLRDHPYSLYPHAAAVMGVSNLVLFAGLLTGTALGAASHAQGLPLFTLLAFVAIYPVGIVLLLISRSREGRTAPNPTDEQASAEAVVKELYGQRMLNFANTYDLTPRERELCGHLVRGHTVKVISHDLGITENTAWTHIRNIYGKCSVNSKQELIDLFTSSFETH